MNTESNRLSALRDYNVLDTPPDGAFDRITALAAYCFQTPIALVSLVDEDRIWFKSKHGLEADQIPRAPGLCGSATFSEGAYVVRNAVTDLRTLDNPLVTGALGLKFYAAAPLITHDGHRLGTFNVIDFNPREFSAAEEDRLKQFASLVMDQMELRLAARKAIESLSQILSGIRHPEELAKLVTVCAWTQKIRIGDKWMSFEEFIVKELGLSVSHGCAPDAEARLYESLGLTPKDLR
ncbi:MAG: hypothetical protein RL616_246 [Verrucomicrobiota bacterium]